jgi:hypothetical protein
MSGKPDNSADPCAMRHIAEILSASTARRPYEVFPYPSTARRSWHELLFQITRVFLETAPDTFRAQRPNNGYLSTISQSRWTPDRHHRAIP